MKQTIYIIVAVLVIIVAYFGAWSLYDEIPAGERTKMVAVYNQLININL
jgi:predicted negative regulator of RcsB-dependent stress response